MKPISLSGLVGLVLASALPTSALPINSAVIHPREFNDIPSATVVSGGSYPSSLAFVEVGVSGPTGFANRDVWHFSADSTTPYAFANDEYFTVSMEVTLTGFPGTPRKEAGFLLDSTIGGQGQFIVNTDAHEVVAFGGPFPFYAFPATFDSGETITLGMTYFLDSVTGLRSIIYSADGVNSPTLPFTNLEQGIDDGSTLGGYFQIVNDPANAMNAGWVMFNNIEIAGVPGSVPDGGATCGFLVLGLLGLAAARKYAWVK
jgi:hypothetical protein